MPCCAHWAPDTLLIARHAAILSEALSICRGAGGSGASGGSGVGATGEEEFRASQVMQEMVLNFLTRMAFLLGEAHKEPDYQVRSSSDVLALTPDPHGYADEHALLRNGTCSA